MYDDVDKDVREVLSYSEQFQRLKGSKDYDILLTSHPKPSKAAQAKVKGAHKILFTDIYAKSESRPLLDLETREIPKKGATIKNAITCFMRLTVILAMHSIAAYYGPKTFTWRNLAIGYLVYAIPGIFGITLCYHRMLTHRSFKTYKWFEYLCAWLGSQAGQGDPIEWVSTHRYHHLHCDTPLDPHSPFEGFWWSHITWLFSTEASMLDYTNAPDLKAQWFYRFLEVTFFPWLFVIKPYLTYQYGGIEAVCWTIAVPMVAGWHSTFLVNSAAHTWGTRPYDTGDLSTNCWWVAAVSFGEGWHNAHHAFPYSARHGLEWWEIDPTWYLICALKALGIVWDVQVPSEKVRASKRAKSAKAVNITAKAQ